MEANQAILEHTNFTNFMNERDYMRDHLMDQNDTISKLKNELKTLQNEAR